MSCGLASTVAWSLRCLWSAGVIRYFRECGSEVVRYPRGWPPPMREGGSRVGWKRARWLALARLWDVKTVSCDDGVAV